ncbi:MAG: hypothetical protein AABX34_06670 [Nanoarchaeota archaeon]
MSEFFFKNWAEFVFFVIMVIGFIVSIWASSYSAVISYIVVFLSGMIGGRLLYERRHRLTFPYAVIIMGFIIGYLIGSYYGSKKVIIVLFVLGILFSYQLLKKGYIRDVFF